MVTFGCAAVAVLLVLSALFIGIRQISRHRSLLLRWRPFCSPSPALARCSSRDSGLRLVSLEGVYILQDGPQALVIGSGRSDYAGQTAAQYLRANGVTDYTLLIPEGKMAFTGGSFSLLTQFPAGQLIAAGNDSRLASALAFAEAGTVVPAEAGRGGRSLTAVRWKSDRGRRALPAADGGRCPSRLNRTRTTRGSTAAFSSSAMTKGRRPFRSRRSRKRLPPPKTRRRGGMLRLGRGLYPPRLDGFTDRFCFGRG